MFVMFTVVNVYLDHLKFCVVCINGRRYVCCGECYVVSNDAARIRIATQTSSADSHHTIFLIKKSHSPIICHPCVSAAVL